MDKSIFIWGSCVTRDTFRICEADDMVIGYIARNTIAAQFSAPYKTPNQALNVSSNFLRRMLECDLDKTVLKRIPNGTKFIIFDFIDEARHRVFKRDSSLLTHTNILNESSLNLTGKEYLTYPQRMELFTKNLATVMAHLSEKKITPIFNIVYYAPADGCEEEVIDINYKLSLIYNHLSKTYPKALYIQSNPQFERVNLNHKWGVAPNHYIDDYYKDTFQKLKKTFTTIKNIAPVNLPQGVTLEARGNSVLTNCDIYLNAKGASYAFYLYKNGAVIEKTSYKNTASHTFHDLQDAGSYQVGIFIKHNDITNRVTTNTLRFIPLPHVEDQKENGDAVKMSYVLKKADSKKLLVILHDNIRQPIPTKFHHDKCNILIPIDDFGAEKYGTWWLGLNDDFFTMRLLDKMMKKVTEELNIEEIYFWGSSMGGYGAILHGIRNKATGVFANAPQVQLLANDYGEVDANKKWIEQVLSADNEYNNLTHFFDKDTKLKLYINQNSLTPSNNLNQHYLPLIEKIADCPNVLLWSELLPVKEGKVVQRMTDSVNKLFMFCSNEDFTSVMNKTQ